MECSMRALMCLLLLALSVGAQSKNVLLVPCQITSHVLEMNSLISGLVKNGHNVYVTISNGFPQADKVIKAGVKPLYFDPLPETLSVDWIASQQFEAPFKVVGYNTSQSVLEDCRAMMQDKAMNAEIERIGFDLAIVDGFLLSYCAFLLPHVHGIPYVFLFSSIHPWLAGVPTLPSFSPLPQGTNYMSDRMTFLERLQNLAVYVFMAGFFPFPGRYDMSLLHEYAPDVPTWESLVYKSELFIETRNFIMERPSASMPNFIQTPGITVSPPKPLPQELEAIMSAADKGVVLVSFGSIAGNFPEHITDKLIEAFNRLEEMSVVWKFSGKSLDNMKRRVKKHVHLLTWMPQNDILGHPKTKVFVTHCGNNGQHEAVYHAVPMVGVPIFAEQFHNAFRQMDRGYGRSIIPGGLMDFSVDELVEEIQEVSRNPTYKASILKASEILKDSPMDPIDTATHWMEHVMKFGGSHLRSHGVHLPWYQYFMVDIILFLAILLHIVGFVLFVVVRKIVRAVVPSTNKTKLA